MTTKKINFVCPLCYAPRVPGTRLDDEQIRYLCGTWGLRETGLYIKGSQCGNLLREEGK